MFLCRMNVQLHPSDAATCWLLWGQRCRMCFHIVTAASLERSEVHVQGGAQYRGPIYTLTDAFNFVSWSSTEPPTQRYRVFQQPVRLRNEEHVSDGIPHHMSQQSEPRLLPGFGTKLKFWYAPSVHWCSCKFWVQFTIRQRVAMRTIFSSPLLCSYRV